MKCTLLREMEQRNPDFDRKAALDAKRKSLPYDVPPTRMAPAGTEIDHADAWRLVRAGIAKPADDECRSAANLSDEEIAVRAAKYEKLNAGRGTGSRQHDVPDSTDGGEGEEL